MIISLKLKIYIFTALQLKEDMFSNLLPFRVSFSTPESLDCQMDKWMQWRNRWSSDVSQNSVCELLYHDDSWSTLLFLTLGKDVLLLFLTLIMLFSVLQWDNHNIRLFWGREKWSVQSCQQQTSSLHKGKWWIWSSI